MVEFHNSAVLLLFYIVLILCIHIGRFRRIDIFFSLYLSRCFALFFLNVVRFILFVLLFVSSTNVNEKQTRVVDSCDVHMKSHYKQFTNIYMKFIRYPVDQQKCAVWWSNLYLLAHVPLIVYNISSNELHTTCHFWFNYSNHFSPSLINISNVSRTTKVICSLDSTENAR